MFKPRIPTSIATALMLALSGPGFANDYDTRDSGSFGYHQQQQQNQNHRAMIHQSAHVFPVSPWGHQSLHQSLDHGRYHDQMNHTYQLQNYRYLQQTVPTSRQFFPYGAASGYGNMTDICFGGGW